MPATPFVPQKIYYEPASEEYPLGRELLARYRALGVPMETTPNHNNIACLRQLPNRDFVKLKKYLIIGTRKTHRYTENHKVSDYLVPFTSSGCTAMCMYCYLVCNYNTCSYLRLFVNREQMMERLLKKAASFEADKVFEIGSNSDMVLENSITGNLAWAVEEFARQPHGKLTFPTKFDMVEPLLGLDHKGRTIARMSVNPQDIIQRVEFGTSPLKGRIDAINQLCEAGYPVGLLIAPVIFLDNWQVLYAGLIDELAQGLSEKVKQTAFIEIIFMTYSYVHDKINSEAFPNAVAIYNKQDMTGRGRGKYWYREALRREGEAFLRGQLAQKLPRVNILYVV